MEGNMSIAGNVYRLRTSAGLSMDALADSADITRKALSDIEKGKTQQPRAANLRKIAQVLKVSLGELYREVPELQSVRFRMNKATSKNRKERDLVLYNLSRWIEDYRFLADELDLFSENLLKKVKSTDPVEAASKLRKVLKIEMDEPVYDMAGLLEKAGVKLHLFESAMDKLFGLSVGEENGGPVVSVNIGGHISVERQIFTAAHELGHLVLHKGAYVSDMFEENEKEEGEANRFASYFLMPHEEFITQLEKCQGLHWVDIILKVKRFFNVSYKTVLMRLVDYKLADKDIYRQFALACNKMYGISLKDHYEPAAIKEPDVSGFHIYENQFNRMVRQALEAGIISMGRAAEMMDLSLEEMRNRARSWEEIRWELLKKSL